MSAIVVRESAIFLKVSLILLKDLRHGGRQRGTLYLDHRAGNTGFQEVSNELGQLLYLLSKVCDFANQALLHVTVFG